MFDIHINRACHEGGLATDCDRNGMDRIRDRTNRSALGHFAQWRRGRELSFRKAINLVIEQDNIDVQVSTNRVHQVIATNT